MKKKKKDTFGVEIKLLKDWEQHPGIIRPSGMIMRVTRDKARELYKEGYITNPGLDKPVKSKKRHSSS